MSLSSLTGHTVPVKTANSLRSAFLPLSNFNSSAKKIWTCFSDQRDQRSECAPLGGAPSTRAIKSITESHRNVSCVSKWDRVTSTANCEGPLSKNITPPSPGDISVPVYIGSECREKWKHWNSPVFSSSAWIPPPPHHHHLLAELLKTSLFTHTKGKSTLIKFKIKITHANN